MGTAANSTNVPQILKNIWEDDIFDYMYEDQPFYALVNHDTSWEGLYDLVTVRYGGMGGRSATFANAQANKSPSVYKQMQVATKDNFGLWSIDHKLITLSRSQKGSLVRALASETEAALKKLKRSSCWMFWRNGGGAIGKIGAISGSTFTFVDVNDIRNVNIGDVLNLSTDDGTGGAGVSAGTALTVTGVDEDSGTVTCSAGIVASIASAAVGDFVFPDGDYGAVFSGVPSYVTLATPGTGGVPASIWGMSRTDHPTALAGSRFTGTLATAQVSIDNALAKAHRRGIKTTHLFASPEVYAAISQGLQSSRRYVEEKVGTVGFSALVYVTQGGQEVKVYSDADIPKSSDAATSYVFGLNMDTWTFKTADEYPMALNSVINGGQKMRVEVDANQSEGRFGGYGNLFTEAPGDNFVLALT